MNNRSYKIIWNKERQQYVVKSPSNAKTFARTALAAATVIGIMSSSVGVVSAATAITDTTSGTVSSNGSPVYVETKTTGNKEIEIGETATAEGVNNIAIGNGSQTTGNESVAIGNTALAGGTVTTSVKIKDETGSKTDPANYTFTTVAAKDATAIGGSTKAQGDQSTAVGYSASAYGNNSIALGMGAVTGVQDQLGKVLSSSGAIGLYGENAVAIGAKAKAQSTASVAIGANTVAIADTVSNFTSTIKRPITVIGTDAIIDGGNKGSNGSTAVGSNSLAGLLYRVKGDTDSNFKDKASFTDADYNTATGGLTTTKNTAITHSYYTNDLFALAGIDTTKATIDVNEATAIGFDARALGDQSIAIGAQTVAGHSSVAIGGNDMNSVSATAKNAYTDNVGKAFPINSISDFYPTTSALDGSVAIGQKAASYSSLGTAIGTAAVVASKATLGTAIGAQTGDGKADAVGTTAIGAGAYANARHATAIAIGSQALGVNSVATGYKSNASGVDSVAIGREAKASGTQSISIGTSNSVSGNYSGAVGDPSIIEGTGSFTVGNDNAVGATSTNVGAFGNNNQIGATATYDSNGKLQTTPGLVITAAVDSSKVVGNNNYVNTSGTYVLGSGIGVKSDKSVMDTVANSVYLGDNSQVLATAGANMNVDGVAGRTTTGGATGSVSTATVKSTYAATTTDAATTTTLTYGGFAGETAVGAVSVGAAGSERRIQNVAAGEISATSTDAINGSQLYVANQVTANVAGSVADIIGGDTTVNPDGTLAVTNIGDTDKTNVSDAIKAAKTTVTSDDNSVTVVSEKEADGHTNYDLAVTKGSLTAGSNGTVTGAAADGVAGATTSNSFATVGDVANAINNSGFTLTTDKTGSGTNSATDSELINPGDTVTMVAGNNLDVKQVDGTVTYALKDAISLSSVTTGDTTMTTDGIVIKNGAAGKPVSLTKGGLDNGGNTITNVAAGTAPNDAVNFSQLTETVAGAKTTVTSDDNSVTVVSTTDTDGHTNYDLAVTKGSFTTTNGTVKAEPANGADSKPITNSFATVGDVATAINNSGFTLTTDKTGSGTNSATDSELINPGDTVTMVAGNNLDVKQEDGTVTYALKEDITLNSVTTGDTTMTTDGIVIKNGAAGKPVSLTKDGLDNGGNTITNVAAGTNDTDAVNVSQLNTKVAGARTTVTSADKTVAIEETVDEDDGHINYDLAVTKGSLTAGSNGTVIGAAAADVDGATPSNSFATVGDVANAINNSGFTLTTDKTGSGTNSATDSELINPGDTVTMVAGNNLDVKQEDGTVTYALKEDITLNSVTTGDTTMTTDGIVIKNGAAGKPVSLTKDGLDNGDNTITNVAAGKNDTDAVNVSQLNTKVAGARTTVTSADKTVAIEEIVDEDDGHINYDLAVTKGSLTAGSNGTVTGLASPDVDGATPSNSFATVGDVANAINNSGFTLKTAKTGSGTNSTTDSELINPGDIVTMVAGNNLDVKQEDGTVTYALKEDITLNSVTTGDTIMTTDGIVIKNGAAGKPVSLTKDGLDNGGNTITNVAAGTAPTDAVNVSQLTTAVAGAKTTVTSDDNSVTVVPTTVKDGHTNYDLAVTKGSFTTTNGSVTAVPANDADSKPITNSFATVGDVANAINNSGFTLKTAKTGSGTNSTTDSELINPGDTVTMVAGNNLDVKQEDGTVTYALKEDITLNSVTTGDTTMTTDGIVIKNGAAGKPVSLTKDGLDNGGNTITNVAAGTAPTDAVNVSQLTTAVAGAKTTVTSDNKTVAVRETTKDDGHTNYDLAVTKGSLTAESNGTVTGTASTDVDGATTSNSFATVGDVANAINNSGFTLKTNKTGTGTNSATGSELINPGDNVTMIAGNNLDVAQSNGTVTYALQNDITLNSVTTGNIVMNNTGLTIGSDSNTTVINAGGITINQGAKGNPVSLTNSGLDNGGNKIINVSPGEADTDAVNVSQLKQMGNNVDLAIADVKDDIADTGANAAALSALKPLQYDPLEPTQIMAGIGGYKGSHALAVGVAHFKNESTMFHAGVTMGNHNTMYNAGVTWKFGNRDEEEAVPDRYKAGPISSVYVMQDEVSAIKVQNQRLLAENKAQKDEIEQMKQMIQALVHKVGL